MQTSESVWQGTSAISAISWSCSRHQIKSVSPASFQGWSLLRLIELFAAVELGSYIHKPSLYCYDPVQRAVPIARPGTVNRLYITRCRAGAAFGDGLKLPSIKIDTVICSCVRRRAFLPRANPGFSTHMLCGVRQLKS